MPVQVFPASAPLAAFVSHYYYIDEETPASATATKKIPDAGIELHIHFGDPFCIAGEESKLIRQRSFIQGPLTNYIEILPGRKTEFIGVKFKPGGFFHFVNGGIKGFADQVIELKDIWGRKIHLLEDAIFLAPDMKERIALIEKFLIYHLNTIAENNIDYCIQQAIQKRGIINVQEMAGIACLSKRQLERNFIMQTGLSPAYFSRIMKMQFVLQDLESGRFANLTKLCYEYEYYDQSHFIKEVSNFTGINPGSIQYSPSCKSQTDYL